MTKKRSFITVGSAIIVIVTALVCSMLRAADNMGTRPKERAVKYKRISIGNYQNFLKNWDENQQPVLYALIQTSAQYDAWFLPAASMGDKRPFAPAANVYTKEQILVVARVIMAPENMDKVFEVERMIERGRALELHYRFNPPKTAEMFSVKNHLAVRIPKRDYEKVIFFENGKQIGELKPMEGRWSVPAATL